MLSASEFSFLQVLLIRYSTSILYKNPQSLVYIFHPKHISKEITTFQVDAATSVYLIQKHPGNKRYEVTSKIEEEEGELRKLAYECSADMT